MTNVFKKVSAFVLAAALLSTAIAVTLPRAIADTAPSASDIMSFKYAMVEDFETSKIAETDGCKNLKLTVTDGKGYQASKGEYVHSIGLKGDKDSSQPFIWLNKAMSITNPTELWIWVDYFSYNGSNDLRLRPRISTTSTQNIDLRLKGGAPVYYQSELGNVKASKISDTAKTTDEGNLQAADLAGFKGFIRIPMSSFRTTDGDNNDLTIDFTKDTITQYVGGYYIFSFNFTTDTSGAFVENGFSFDDIMFTGSNLTGGNSLSDLILGKASGTNRWQAAMIEDFETDQIQDNKGCTNIKLSVTDGKGYNSSKGEYVFSTGPKADKDYCQPFIWLNKVMSVTNPQEFWIYVDYSNYKGSNSLRLRPRVDTASTKSVDLRLKGACPVYYQSLDGTVKVSMTTATAKASDEADLQAEDLAGFKGFIRIPMSTFRTTDGDGDNLPIDLTTDTIIQYDGGYYIFNFNFTTDTSGAYVENGFAFDDLMFVGPSLTGGSSLAETLNGKVPDPSAWNAALVQDFETDAIAEQKGCTNVRLTVTDNKGFRSSKGEYVHSIGLKDDKDYCQPFIWFNKELSIQDPEEFCIWVDYSSYTGESSLRLRPRICTSTTQNVDLRLKGGAPVYYQKEDGTVISSAVTSTSKPTDEGNLDAADLKGFKGFIRIPLSSFRTTDGDNADVSIDFSKDSIVKYVGGYYIFNFNFTTDASGGFVENGYSFDDIMFIGPDLTGGVPLKDILNPSTTTTTGTSTTKTSTTETSTTSTSVTGTTTTKVSAAGTTTSGVITPAETTSSAKTISSSETTKGSIAPSSAVTAAPATLVTTEPSESEETTAATQATEPSATTNTPSPKTGETSPSAACALALLAVTAGIVFLQKKKQ